MDNYHITKKNDRWGLTKQGNKMPSKTADTKAEIVKQAAKFVKSSGGGSVKIHKENGRIQEERTYPRSKDPSRTPG